MHASTTFEFPTLSKWHKSRFLRSATQVLTSQQQMGLHSNNIVKYVLRDVEEPVRIQHYPNGDRIDRQTGGQYFYHCHRENYVLEEHGHFHCFLRYPFIPKRIKPAAIPHWDKYIENPMAHIVSISMNRYGQPVRLFTVNRWVSAEIWYPAEHVSNFIKRYKMTLSDDPYWVALDQWIESMLHLFSPQITWLHQQRDAMIAELQAKNPDKSVYDDETVEELSQISIDLKKQIEWLIETPHTK